MFVLTGEKIDYGKLKLLVDDARAGAVVTFEGQVRNHNEGHAVLALEYEAYDALCIKEAGQIIEEAIAKFDVIKVVAAHRYGKLAIGDMAVFVAVSAAHRQDAFLACRFLIDEIKARLPIWKKEVYADGRAEWVNCQTCGNHVRAGAVSLS